MSCRCEKKYPAGKILLEPTREHTANSTHVWRPRRDLNAGHIVEVRVLSLVRHPCSTPAPPPPTPLSSTLLIIQKGSTKLNFFPICEVASCDSHKPLTCPHFSDCLSNRSLLRHQIRLKVLVFLVLFRLGEVLDPQAKLYMILYGDRGESGKIYLTPSDGTTFEPGKQYRVSVNIKDIGKVRLWVLCQTRVSNVRSSKGDY